MQHIFNCWQLWKNVWHAYTILYICKVQILWKMCGHEQLYVKETSKTTGYLITLIISHCLYCQSPNSQKPRHQDLICISKAGTEALIQGFASLVKHDEKDSGSTLSTGKHLVWTSSSVYMDALLRIGWHYWSESEWNQTRLPFIFLIHTNGNNSGSDLFT